MTYEETRGRCGRYRHHRDGHCGVHGAFRRMRHAARRRSRLTRDADEAMLAGVCAGIARHLGLRPKVVRIATVVSLILFTVPTVIAYGLIAWLAPTRDEPVRAAPSTARSEPADPVESDDIRGDISGGGSVEGLARLKNRFRALEEKFADIEAQMLDDRPA
jgi:phage shock protein PspC (stress-responsive transcriptional regulator)